MGPGFRPVFLRSATSRTRCWPRRQSDVHNAPFPLIGEIPPVPVLFLPHQRPLAFDGTRVSANSAPAGAKFGIYPCGGSLPQKGKISGSPGFPKPGADQCLDPPALLAVTATPLAFGMIGDFPLRIAEEIPIPVFFQMFTSSLVFQGGLPPVFRRIFALCPAFQRRVGYLTLPQRKKRHTGATVAFTGFTQCGWYVFYKCVFSYTSKFRRHRNGFSDLQSDALQLHIRDRKMYFRCRLRLCHTFATEKNANSSTGATTFPLLPHLPHIIFTRLPLQ